MKSLRKKLALLLTVLCITSLFLGSVALANESTEIANPILVVINGECIQTDAANLDKVLQQYGVVEKKSATNSKLDKSVITKTNADMTPMDIYDPHFFFDKRGYIENYTRTDLRRRISTIVFNATQDPVLKTVNYSVTQGYSCNTSLTTKMKTDIQSTVSVTLTYSVSKSESVTFTVGPGYYGWMEYTPIMRNVWGYYKFEQYIPGQGWYTSPGDWVDLYTPKRTETGLPDGIYVPKTSKTSPV